ncbi:AraC family transcriptional regulator [Phyllobacterium myrsinacearum]|uniref:AraC family transcriptional regulator n=2 Tax=Phyllobacterium myrsinacearum TaxID=28101 RepID=A0A2S9JCC3_9HYPH|nr:AraC family transcriptional regulator [Phyllobacterium myrsinacearum]
MLFWKSFGNGIKSIIRRSAQTKISAGFPMNSHQETPVLANCSGQYRESVPQAALKPHFLCVWSHVSPHAGGKPVTVVPDGCVDILWSQGRLSVAGPDIAPHVVDPGITSVVGLRFAPGAAAKWLGLPMSELVGLRVDLSELWGTKAAALVDALSPAQSEADAMRRLEAGIAAMAGAIDRPDAVMSHTFSVLGRVGEGSHVSRLASHLDMSARTLRRHCRTHFGYGPKTLERILRFQHFLHLAQCTPESSLGMLAFEADYADQAHLSREVKALAGISPGDVVQQMAA